MAERLDWFPCNPTKLLNALAEMNAPEGYLYCVVLFRIYETGGPCRDTVQALSNRTKLTRKIIATALESLFQSGKLRRDPDGIVNAYASEVLANVTAKVRRAKRSGERGARVRWAKTEKNQGNGHSDPIDPPLRFDSDIDSKSKNPVAKATDAPASRTRAEQERDLFKRGKEVLGRSAGGMITALLRSREFDVALARSVIETASTKQEPREYVAAAIQQRRRSTSNGGKREGSLLDALDRVFGPDPETEDEEVRASAVRSLPARSVRGS